METYKLKFTGEEIEQSLTLVNDSKAKLDVINAGDGENSTVLGAQQETVADNTTLVPNKAVSPASVAEGNCTVAGCKAFVIKGSRNVELDAPIDETIPESNVVGIYTLDSVDGIEIGDEFSIQYNYNYDLDGSVIAIGPIDESSDLGYALEEDEIACYGSVVNDTHYDPEIDGNPILWFPNKPTIGTTPWGTGQHAEGEGTKAVGPQAHAEGYYTTASGKFSHAEGKETFAVYCSHAEGRGTQSLGEISHAEGDRTIAKGFAAHSEGNKTQAIGNQSHAGGNSSIARGTTSFAHGSGCEAIGMISFATGQGTKATASTQFVAGSYNATRDDAALIIGNGSKDSPRSNAFVVMKDGSGELSKQGTSANSIVIRDTLNKVVEYCGIQEIKTTDNVLAVDPTISVSGEFLISASNSGEIKKFGTNLLKTNKTYDANGIVTKLDPSEPSGIIINGTAAKELYEVQAAYYSIYLPTGHYTFFIEGLDSKHSSDNVYFSLLGTNAAGEETGLARVNSVRSMVEFDISEDITEAISKIRVKAFINTDESFADEHIKFQLQVGGKTEFTSYKKPTTIELVAEEETVIVVDDLTPFTLVSQTDDNTLTCKYPVSTKEYIDKNRGRDPRTFIVYVGTNWVTDTVNGGYYQTIALYGISSTDDPIADVLLGSDITTNSNQLLAWENITRITTADGSITLYANVNKPSVAFTIRLKVV